MLEDKKKINNTSKSMTVATVLVMIGLIFSKCSGFLRDIFVGIKFNDVYCDGFTLAFTIPDLIYNLLIGGSIQSAITPNLSASIQKGEEDRGLRATSIFITVFSLIMFVVCFIGVVFSKPLFALIYSSGDKYNPETIDLASMASKFLFPQIFFMMFAALCIGILNAYKRFSSTAFGPTIYNIFVLLSIYLFAGNSNKKLMTTTAGIMIAAIIYFLFQYVIGFDKLKKIRFILKPTDKDFKALLLRALPILVSASVVQINVVILNYFATRLPDNGNVHALRCASTVWQLPYGIFAVAIGNVMLPSLAMYYANKDYKGASKLLSDRLKSALFLTIPSAFFIAIMNSDVIRAIFQWNDAFSDEKVNKAGAFLLGYSIAIITHTVVFIMNQAFYAIGKTKVPLIAGSIGLISNPILCTLFMSLNLGMGSLTLSYSITSILQMMTLIIIYTRYKALAPRKLSSFLIKTVFSSLIMTLVIFVLNKFLVLGTGKFLSLTELFIKGIIAVFIYFLLAFFLEVPQAYQFISSIRSKLLRSK